MNGSLLTKYLQHKELLYDRAGHINTNNVVLFTKLAISGTF